MKRFVLLTLCLLMFLSAAVLFADTQESEFYAKSVHIYRIYPHKLGYRVDYSKSNLSLGSFYAPMKWFSGPAGIGEIILGNSRSYPYMTLFFKDGQVDHFRLYLKSDMRDMTWGSLEDNDAYNDHFGDEQPVLDGF